MVLSTSKIADWNDADRALARLGELHRNVTTHGTKRDAAIDVAKTEYARHAKPLLEQIGDIEQELSRFVQANQADLDGRSRRLNHGRVGFLRVSKLTVRSVKKAIAWLLDAKKMQYLRVDHELNKEALHDAPPDILRACSAKVKSEDQCWYEVDETRHAVKD